MTDTVFQASAFKAYTPAANAIVTYAGFESFKHCTFFLPAAADITFTDFDGNSTSLTALDKGYHPIQVSKITACSGTVYLMKQKGL